MATLTLASVASMRSGMDALVTGVIRGPSGPVLASGSDEADRACGHRLAQMLAVLGACGDAEEVTLVPAEPSSPVPLIAAVGLGRPAEPDGRVEPEALRRAAGAAVRALAGRERIGLTLPLVNGGAGSTDAHTLEDLAANPAS